MFLRLKFLMGLFLCLEHQFKNEAFNDWYTQVYLFFGAFLQISEHIVNVMAA